MLASAKHSVNHLSTIERAITMGIRIITPHAIQKWRQQLDQLKNTKEKLRNNNRQVIIKIEDDSKLYRPEIKFLKNGFQELDFTGFGSPFDLQSAYNLRSNKKTHPNTCKLTTVIEAEMKRVRVLKNDPQSGYCELCQLEFNNRTFHLRGRIHRLNIDSKYDGLDRLISNSLLSFDSFIRHHGNEDDDDNYYSEKKIPSSEITVNAISPIQLAVKYAQNNICFATRLD